MNQCKTCGTLKYAIQTSASWYLYKKGNTMFELTWQEFSRRPHIIRLPIHEQKQQFFWEQQRHQMLMEYISSAASGVGGSGAGGGNSTVVQAIQANQDQSVNNYVENNYIDNYFI